MSVLQVINPRTGTADFEIPDHDAAHVAQVASRLRTAQNDWFKAGVEYRCEVFMRWGKAVEKHAADITAALRIDTGRKLMAQVETQNTVEKIRYWTEQAPRILSAVQEGESRLVPGVHYRYQLVPYPVVGVISPWNVPLILALIDTMPALLAGSAVLLKPSEITPRFATPLQASIEEVPELAAVFKIVTGGPGTGQALIDNVDLVCFTGSVATGRKVAVHAAQNFIPAFLELGGKDPAIVLPSANLENAANAILRSAAGLTGQACQSLERIYVHQSVMQPFVKLLADKASSIRINWPDISSGHMGPFIFQPQAHKVREQIEEAVALGATVHCGGEVSEHEGGYWCLPTVLTGVNHSMKLMREETFGPVLPVISFADENEAVHLANDSEFGLSAAVFAGSREEGEAVAQQIRAGAVSINDAGLTVSVHDVEKNAFCLSGMGGSRMGDAGLLRFFRKQALMHQSAPVIPLEYFDESAAT
ncbi:MAG TPA: aldehyde dehydrogenase family protein [Xanthomonadales bacterium]|nr:aldehyde dehydrogenase family protein [Xanthomonadales bacterium]